MGTEFVVCYDPYVNVLGTTMFTYAMTEGFEALGVKTRWVTVTTEKKPPKADAVLQIPFWTYPIERLSLVDFLDLCSDVNCIGVFVPEPVSVAADNAALADGKEPLYVRALMQCPRPWTTYLAFVYESKFVAQTFLKKLWASKNRTKQIVVPNSHAPAEWMRDTAQWVYCSTLGYGQRNFIRILKVPDVSSLVSRPKTALAACRLETFKGGWSHLVKHPDLIPPEWTLTMVGLARERGRASGAQIAFESLVEDPSYRSHDSVTLRAIADGLYAEMRRDYTERSGRPCAEVGTSPAWSVTLTENRRVEYLGYFDHPLGLTCWPQVKEAPVALCLTDDSRMCGALEISTVDHALRGAIPIMGPRQYGTRCGCRLNAYVLCESPRSRDFESAFKRALDETYEMSHDADIITHNFNAMRENYDPAILASYLLAALRDDDMTSEIPIQECIHTESGFKRAIR